MKPNPVKILSTCIAAAFLAAFAPLAFATTYYWDADGIANSFGTASGTWGSDSFWSTDINGSSAGANTTITTADSINFGTATLGLAAGTIAGPATAQGFLSMSFGAASGNVTISGGTLNVPAGTATITLNNSADTISTVLQGSGGLTKSGSGKLTLSGANTYTGATLVSGGILNLTGSISPASGTSGTLGIVGGAVYQSGSSSSFTATTNSPSRAIVLGGNQSATTGGYGYYNLSGGTLSAGTSGQIEVGGNGNTTSAGIIGVMDVTGGAASAGGSLQIARGANVTTPASGLLNVIGGSVTVGTVLQFAESSGGLAIANVGGGAGAAVVTVNGTSGGIDLANQNSAGTSILNLLANGTLTASQMAPGQSTPVTYLNFNGGTLKTLAATTVGSTFLTSANIDNVIVYNNGGTIDNNGVAITIGKVLTAATGSGVSSISGPTAAGSGYIGAPLVTISGGTGTGATAYAVMSDDGTGAGTYKVSSIVVTSPGVYTVAPTTVTLTGGGASTAASGFTINTAANTPGGMTFTDSAAAATTILSISPTYTGDTTISGSATLKLSANSVNLNSSPNLNVSATAATLDLSAYASGGYTLAANQNILGSGAVYGASFTASSTSKIIPGTDGTAGTLTFGNGLTVNSGSTVKFDLSATSGGSNDKIVLSGAGALLTPNGAQITINSAGTLDTSTDYVLFDLTGGSGAATSGAFNTQPIFVGTTPANPLNYSIVTTATQVKLQYSAAVPLSGIGSATPSSVWHSQSPLLKVTVTPGTSPASTGIAVVADLSSVGGSASQTFYDDGTHGDVTAGDNVFSYSYTIPVGTSLGAKILNATVTDAQSRSASPTIGLTIIPANETWSANPTGANWGTAGNWTTGFSPATGDPVFFDASSQLSPNLETGYSVESVTFNSAAGVYTIGGSTLTLTGGGVTNNSANAQTINTPVALSSAQTVNAASGDVTFGGVVSGSASLTKVGSGKLTLAAGNTYSSGTTLAAGQLNINNGGDATHSAIGTGTLTISGGTIDNTSSGDVTLAPNNAQSWNSSFSYAGSTHNLNLGSGAVTLGASPTVTVSANSLSVGGAIGGAFGLTKTGNGTLVLSGASTYTGATLVSGGKLNLTGSIVPAAGSTSSLGIIGGAVYQSSGTFTVTKSTASQAIILGGNLAEVTGGYGYYNLSSGTLSAGTSGNIEVGGISSTTSGTIIGVMDVTGGIAAAGTLIQVGRGGNGATGMLNITGGSVTAGGALQLDANNSGVAIMNVGGGAGPAAATANGTAGGANAAVDMANQNSAGTNILNLLANGTLTASQVYVNSATPTVFLNFNGGTLKALTGTAVGSTFLTSVNLDNVLVCGGGGTIDNNGINVTVSTPLTPVTGNGLTSIPVSNGGSGYMGAPFVKISGDGSGASAYAVVSGGAVTSIVITSPGKDFTTAPTVTLIGGGATTAATLGTVTIGANAADGGMTFVGSGTTTLSGPNTYTGGTTISSGTMLVNGSLAGGAVSLASGATLGGNGTIGGPVSVNSGGTLAPGTSIGTLTLGAVPALGGTTRMEVNSTNAPANSDNVTLTSGALNYGGALVVTNLGPTPTNGTTFTLFTSSGGYGTGFSSVTLPTGNTTHWKTNNLLVDGTITFSNSAPVAGTKSYSVAQGEVISITIASGNKSLATDADSDTLAVTDIGGTNAVDYGTVVISSGGASITYTNTSGSAGSFDTFSYTVSDGFGGLATNSISIQISPATGANLVSATAGGGNAYLTYAGIPGTNYALDHATSVVAPITWTQVQTKPAETNGFLRFTNNLSTYPTNDFYRTRYVP